MTEMDNFALVTVVEQPARARPALRPRVRLPRQLRLPPDLLLAGGVALVALLGAYLVSGGNWHIAIAAAVSIPALILLHRFPYLAVVAWLALSPFLVQTPSAVERQIYWMLHRLLPPFTILLILVSTGLRIRTRELPRMGVPEWAMLGYLLVSVLSILLLNDTPAATLTRYYDKVIAPMCLYAVIRMTAPGIKLMRWLVPVAVYIVVTQVIIGQLSWTAPYVLPSQWLNYAGQRTTGSLNSVSVFSVTLIFAGLLVLHTAMNMRPGWKRLALTGIFLSVLYAVFISYSRASWLAGVLVVAGVFLVYPRFILRLGLLALPAVLLLGGILLARQLQTATQRFESDQTALSRLPVLVAAYRMFEARPVFGWGYANFDRYDRRFQGRFGDITNPDEKDLTSHNVYMTLLAEQGLVGAGLFLLVPGALLWRSLQVHRRLPARGWMSRQTLWLLWLVILAHFVVNNFAPMVVVFGLGQWWLVLGLIAGLVASRKAAA